MIIISYVPKLQALDKSVAILAEIRFKYPGSQIFTIVEIEGKNQIDCADTLLTLTARVSDLLLFFGYTKIHLKAFKALSKHYHNLSISRSLDDVFASLESVLDVSKDNHVRQRYYLIPYTGSETSHGIQIAQYLKSNNFRVVAYFKSLHDQGLGFSSLNLKVLRPDLPKQQKTDHSSYSLQNFFAELLGKIAKAFHPAVNKRIGQTKQKQFHKIDLADVDVLLAFNDTHKKLLRDKLKCNEISTAGYQLLYEGWKKLVLEYNHSTYCSVQEFFEVILFTRGETPGKPPELNVVPHAMLEKLLGDIFTELEALGRPYRVRIKPHPIQDVCFLQSLIHQHQNVSITYDPPAILAATANLAISTYSSTVIDALIFGVPSIEYFEENEFFKKKHPGGSPFIRFGALPARTRVEFRGCLEKVVNVDYSVPDVEEKLGQKSNLNFLDL